ncbi:MAG: GAF domain-containing protein [Chloroflexota bacterium]
MTAYDVRFKEAFAELTQRGNPLEDVLDDVCEWLLLEYDLYFVSIYQPSASRDRILMVAGSPWGAFEAITGASYGLPINNQSSIVALSIANSEVYLIDDCLNDTYFLPNPIIPLTRSQVAIPLIDNGTSIGAITLHAAEVAAFRRRDMQWIPALSHTLSDLIVNYQAP